MSDKVEHGRGKMSAQDKMHRMLGYWAATAALYVFCVGVLLSEIAVGKLDRNTGLATISIAVLGVGAFYVLIRHAVALGIANWKLTAAQALFAVFYDLLLYAVLGSHYAGILTGLPVVMVFCAFSLRPRQIIAVASLAVAGLAVTSALVHAFDPLAYPAKSVAINFILTTVGIIAVTIITGDLHRLRRRLHAQAEDLMAALARIELLATTDELTALSNRRHMQQLLEQEQRRHCDQARPTCIALIDVDHFKQINDRFGHAGGDAALRALAREARCTLRGGDTLARWGGEEFLLLMPATALADAHMVVNRMLAKVSQMPLMAADPSFRMTFSAGVVECRPEERFTDAILRSDRAMYEAKAGGRNVVLAA